MWCCHSDWTVFAMANACLHYTVRDVAILSGLYSPWLMFACISCTVLHVVLKSYLEWTISAIVSVCLHLIRCISRGVEEFILSGLYPPLSMFVCISYIVLHVVLKS